MPNAARDGTERWGRKPLYRSTSLPPPSPCSSECSPPFWERGGVEQGGSVPLPMTARKSDPGQEQPLVRSFVEAAGKVKHERARRHYRIAFGDRGSP
eukprot:8882976-Pyramimonas_sp.AAC.1